VFLADTLDWLKLWHHDAGASSDPGGNFDTKSNPLSPQP